MTSARPSRDERWHFDALLRIDVQMALVARLAPGSADHKLAMSVLLTLQDSLFVMSQARGLIRAAQRMSDQPLDG